MEKYSYETSAESSNSYAVPACSWMNKETITVP